MDAWSFSDPRARSRLFVSIAAPGLTPLAFPTLSPWPPASIKERCISRAPYRTGKFGERMLDYAAPFPRVTFGEATSELPLNLDGLEPSVRYPDHMPVRQRSPEERLVVSCIPRHGPGHPGLQTAKRDGLMTRDIAAAVACIHRGKLRDLPTARCWQYVQDSLPLPILGRRKAAELHHLLLSILAQVEALLIQHRALFEVFYFGSSYFALFCLIQLHWNLFSSLNSTHIRLRSNAV